MKIHSLTINDVRGIRDLRLEMSGGNVVVYGQNASGKSGVVDAIDFLLSGKIARLAGEGTERMSLEAHGCHVDADPDDALVSATVEFSGWEGPVELTRRLAQPKVLDVVPAEATSVVDPSIVLAGRRQHVLTRREILDYITATAGSRAEQIQKLLGIEDIPAVRLVLQKAAKAARTELVAAQRAFDQARGRVAACLDCPGADDASLLVRTNELLGLIGAPSIEVLSYEGLAQLPAAADGRAPSAAQVAAALRALEELLAVRVEVVNANSDSLNREIERLATDPELMHALRASELLRLGLDLIDDSGSCPLCGHEWPIDELELRLRSRWSQSEEAGVIQRQIVDLAGLIRAAFVAVLAQVEEVLRRVEAAGLDVERAWLTVWASDLRSAQELLTNPLARPDELVGDLAAALTPDELGSCISRVEAAAAAEAEDLAGQALVQLAGVREALTSLGAAAGDLDAAADGQRVADTVFEAFEQARGEILSGLFDAIVGRFVELYRGLHGEDEGQFDAALEIDGAGMQMDVDFYGRGMHPVGSVHSEGHLDSMGICLFLALNEYLSGNALDVVVLDDVVMSVDRGHRRAFAELLAREFPNKQFVITTHEDDWAMQLQATGVATRERSFRFYAWDVETGPQVEFDADVWASIERDLAAGNVGAAAQRLRRWGEYFFASECELLIAAVPLHMDGRWTLGEVLPAAKAKLGRHLRSAGNATDDQTVKERIQARATELDRAYALTYAEQWAVNSEVHYNSWSNLSPEDFAPVAAAFSELAASFTCDDCGAQLSIARGNPDLLQCRCGRILWRL